MIPEAAVDNGRMTEQDWTDEPTNEYAMRQAANGMIHFTNKHRDLPIEDLELIDYAYKQLLRGANMIRATK